MPTTTPVKSIRICYVNARSLRNKFTDLEEIAASNNYDIIGVTESWINTTTRDFLAEYNLLNYSLFSCERTNRIGGGVLLYVRACLHPVVVTKEKINNIDAIYLQLKGNSSSLILGLVYRPPCQNIVVDDQLYEQIADISCSSECVIFGDFNIPVAKWGDTLNSHSGNNLYSSLLESDLVQHVHQPTRGPNILDLILSTNDHLVSNVHIGQEFSTSDHKIVTFNLAIEPDNVKSSNERIPDYQRADFNKLRSLIQRSDWTDTLSSSDINENWVNLTNILNSAIKSSIPFKPRRPPKEPKPKWWNQQIKNSINAKKRAHRKHVTSQNQADKREYERLRRESKKLIKQSKRNLEEHIANKCKSNPKEFYSYVRKKKVIASNIGPLINENGQQLENDTEIANSLNNYFASVFTTEDPIILPAISDTNDGTSLSNIIVTENDIVKGIEKLKVNKTPGPDKISPRILKEIKNEISKPLTPPGLPTHHMRSGQGWAHRSCNAHGAFANSRLIFE